MGETTLMLAATLLVGPAAWANTIYFEFTFCSPGVSASGILATTPMVPGEYLITGVSGERNGAPITAFLYPTTGALGSLVYLSNGPSVDNLLFVPSLNGPFSGWENSNDTPSGFVYQTVDRQFNPFAIKGLTHEYNLRVGGSDDGIPSQCSVAQEAPEPAGLALTGGGWLGLAGLPLRRRPWRDCAPVSCGTKAHKAKKSSKELALPSDTVIELNSCGPGTFGFWQLRGVWSRFYIGSKNLEPTCPPEVVARA